MKANVESRASARISQETENRLKKVAKDVGISVSDLIRIGIVKFLPDVESGKTKITLEDLRDAN